MVSDIIEMKPSRVKRPDALEEIDNIGVH
jgi:hypothetical protein